MKFRRTIKSEALGIPLTHAGFTEIIDEQSMRRVIRSTMLRQLDTQEEDPDSLSVPKAMRPEGCVVGMRNLLRDGRIETFASVYEVIPR
jgi:hypothetical protein